jgi:hypothetical protein
MKITRRQLRQLIKEELSIVSEGYGLKTRVSLIEPKRADGLMDLTSAYGEIEDPPEPVEFTVKKGKVKGDRGTTRDEVQRITDLVLSDSGAPYFRGRRKTGDAQREIVKKGTFTVGWSK